MIKRSLCVQTVVNHGPQGKSRVDVGRMELESGEAKPEIRGIPFPGCDSKVSCMMGTRESKP